MLSINANSTTRIHIINCYAFNYNQKLHAILNYLFVNHLDLDLGHLRALCPVLLQ
jgi:hypothetical protein